MSDKQPVIDNKEEEWITEDKFTERIGKVSLSKYRNDNPGLWRIDEQGRCIYNVPGWIMKFSYPGLR